MKKTMLTLLVITAFTAFTASANSWVADYAQGSSEFRVSDNAGNDLTFSCGQDMQGNDTRSITMGLGDKFFTADDSNVSIVATVDGKKIELDSPSSHVGSDNLDFFWSTITHSKNNSFTVTVNGSKPVVFTTAGAIATYKDDLAKSCIRF